MHMRCAGVPCNESVGRPFNAIVRGYLHTELRPCRRCCFEGCFTCFRASGKCRLNPEEPLRNKVERIAHASTSTWILVLNPPRICRWLVRRFFSRTCTVLMGAYDGGVNHHVFVIVITRQQLENTLKNPALRPSTKPLMNRFPVTETLR